MPRLTKKTAVAVVAPVAVVADEEPEEVAPVVPNEVAPAVPDAVPEPEEVDEVPDDEPSEEIDPVLEMLQGQEQTLTEQRNQIKKKHFDSIIGLVEAIEAERNALQEKIRALDLEIERLKKVAHDKGCEESNPITIKLEKVRATIATYLGQRVVRNPQRNSSGEVANPKKSTFFSRKEPKEIVNQNTRFIYEQKKGCVFRRFCYISKSENCVYECDENGTKIGQAFKSLNDFCVMVKKSVNYQGSLKQDTSVVLKYYDISSGEYKSFKDLTAPLN